MPKHKAGTEPENKLNKQKQSKKRKPDRLKSDGSKDSRNWPANSGHPKSQGGK